MGQQSRIEWTDATFNPWIGCEKIAPECDHCYAATRAKRVGEPELWQGERRRTTDEYWAAPLKWARTLPAELGRRPRVFCASLADVFDNKVPREWRADLFRLIRATPELDWLLLTKRIGNARGMIADALTEGHLLTSREPFWPWPHVWFGITAGTQAGYARDVVKLLSLPAAVRFLSVGPMLGPMRLDLVAREGSEVVYYDNPLTGFRSNGYGGHFGAKLDWVIVEGESGAGARPMHPDWPRAVRAQCAEYRTPFLFKQWGEWAPYDAERDGELANSPQAVAKNYGHRFRHLRPDGVDERDGTNATATVVRIGKKASGRLLDGQLHDEFPRPLPSTAELAAAIARGQGGAAITTPGAPWGM